MTDTITLTGIVATDPRHIVTSEGLAITTFRLASAQRRFDKAIQKWVDADTNWYSITAFRQLAINTSASLKRGERVVLSGRLRIREWDNGERKGTAIDVEADALGYDMSWGSSTFSRSVVTVSVVPEVPPGTQAPDDFAPVQRVESDEAGVESDAAALATDTARVEQAEAVPF